MPVAVMQQSEQITADAYDAVNAKAGVHDDPPQGLIVHTAGAAEGGFRIFDVWESREAYDRFRDERLLPAIREVIGQEALDAAPTSEVYELHDVIRG
jgi:quinol monooxygenase YgiN